jgi:hypothetical protein
MKEQNLKWLIDPYAEKLFRDFGLKPTVTMLRLKQIDWPASLMNNARVGGAVDENKVEQIGMALEDGLKELPMPVLWKLPQAKLYSILGGNHRLKGLELFDPEAEFNAYVIDSDDARVHDVLPRALNCGNGLCLNREDTLRHAVYVAKTYGTPTGQVEAMFLLGKDVVGKELRAEEARIFFAEKHVATRDMTRDQAIRLKSIPNDNVSAAAARVAVQAKMNTDQVVEFVRQIKAERTEATQTGVIAQYEKAIESRNGQPPVKHPRNTRTKFLITLTTFENYVKGVTKLSQLQITSLDEHDEISKRCKKLADHLAKLARSPQPGTKARS